MPGKLQQRDVRPNRDVSAGTKYGLMRMRDSRGLDFAGVDAGLFVEAVAHVVLAGDALLLGMTRDQSALKIQILTDSGAEDLYVGTTQALEDALRVIKDAQT